MSRGDVEEHHREHRVRRGVPSRHFIEARCGFRARLLGVCGGLFLCQQLGNYELPALRRRDEPKREGPSEMRSLPARDSVRCRGPSCLRAVLPGVVPE